MEEKVQVLLTQAKTFIDTNQLAAAIIAGLFLIILWRKPAKTIRSTLLLAVMMLFGIWFWQMFDSRNTNSKWKKGDQKTIERVENAINQE